MSDKVIHVANMKDTGQKWGEKPIFFGKLLDHPKKAPGEWYFVVEPDAQGQGCIMINGGENQGLYLIEPV